MATKLKEKPANTEETNTKETEAELTAGQKLAEIDKAYIDSTINKAVEQMKMFLKINYK